MERFQKILYFLLILSIFFPIRHVFVTNSAYQTGAYSDFTSFSLYLSDIIILTLFLINIKGILREFRKHHVIIALVTWILITFLIQSRHLVSLNYYFFARFIELIALYLIVGVKPAFISKKKLAVTFVTLATLESIIGLLQFFYQKSLGLYRLGESHLEPNLAGVAKIVSHGTRFIRGYGTFPHSNLLSAVLLAAILFSFYLIFISTSKWQKIIFSTLLALNIFGLTVSFSRAGLGATILSSAIVLVWLIIAHKPKKKTLWLSLITIVAFVAAFAVFQQFLFTRATITDDAVKERVFYDHVGLNIVKKYPWQGTGFGTSMLHMQQFSPVKLEPWQIQPIHNYYLLAAADIGIVGAGLFVILFLWHLIKLKLQLLKNRRQIDGDYVYKLVLFSILLGFLILMLFDHYFYTIEQTQLLLWLILGLSIREIQEKSLTYDTPSAL